MKYSFLLKAIFINIMLKDIEIEVYLLKKYILCEQINEYYHAGSKARNDIKRISLNYDYQP